MKNKPYFKKFRKKFILGVGTISTLAVPIATTISCGSLLGSWGSDSEGKYDSVNDKKIVIQTTWSTGGRQLEALRQVVQNYNNTEKSKSEFMKVVIEKVQGGYGTVAKQAITKIQSKDTRTLPNLYIDYPGSVGMINPYGMAYDVSDVIKKEWFEEIFLKENDNISGVKKGGIYSVPLAKSTQALIYNKPLLKWMIEKMQLVGLSFQIPNFGTLKKIMDHSISSFDRSAIKKQWGKLKSNANVSKIKLSNDVFSNYHSLFDFINKVQVLFENPGKGNILGFDSITNFVYLMSSLMTQNQESKFLFSKNKKTSWVDYNFLKKGSKEQELFQKIYGDYIKPSLDTNALWVGDGGEYGSNRLKKHQMAISVGSTAGLHYSYSGNSVSEDLNKQEVGFQLPINKFKSTIELVNGKELDWNNVNAIIQQGPSFNTIHINEEENRATKRFLKWFYRNKTALMEEKIPVDYFSSRSAYVVPLKGSFEDNSVIYNEIASKTFSSLKGSSLGVKASYDAIKREIENQKNSKKNSSFVFTPVDGLTSSMRTMIDSQISASRNSKLNGNQPYDKGTIWLNLRRQAIIDQIIPDDGTLSTKYIYPNMLKRNFSDINWEKFSHIDGVIEKWTDGDTPVIKVTSNSGHSSTKEFKPGQFLSIRVAAIDTPESNVKLGDMKFKFPDGKGGFKYDILDDKIMGEIIEKYENLGKPLYSKYRYSDTTTFYNKLSVNPKQEYNYWRNIWVDIKNGEDYQEIEDEEDRTFNFRKVEFTKDKKKYKLVSESALREGRWGYKATKFGENSLPKGSKVRIATNGARSYRRVVGSIFYGENLGKNYAVEIIKSGKTMPSLTNPAEVLNKNSIMWHLGQVIADSFNYVLENPIGLFKKQEGYSTIAEFLSDTLLTHGSTDYSALLKTKKDKKFGTVYDYMRIRKPNLSLYRKKINNNVVNGGG